MGRVEVLADGERRRSWTLEQKHEIVGESLRAGLTPTEVARKYKISTGQLYTWRQQLLDIQRSVVSREPLRFTPVELAPPQISPPAPVLVEPPVPTVPNSVRPDGLIEIELPGGVLVRVDAHVDSRALRRVLGALESR